MIGRDAEHDVVRREDVICDAIRRQCLPRPAHAVAREDRADFVCRDHHLSVSRREELIDP
jgi:hypothetical protein